MSGFKLYCVSPTLEYTLCKLILYAWIHTFALTVMSVSAFICNHNSFLIYGSLEEPTLKNWSRVTHVSVSLAVVISIVFAACGYMTFTGYTEGKLLDPSILLLAVILTFPPFCLTFAVNILVWFWQFYNHYAWTEIVRTVFVVTPNPKQVTKMSAMC